MIQLERSLKVTLLRQGVTVVMVDVDSKSALIGSGSHCDVRVGPEDMAIEQLFLELKPAGLFGDARAETPLVQLDGAPFFGGRIKEGGIIQVGQLTVQVDIVERQAKRKSALAEQLNGRVLLGLALIMALGAFFVHKKLGSSKDLTLLDPPPLFAAKVVDCPENAAEAAGAAAEELLTQADGRRERAPFVPEDAIEAVHLYRQVAACLRVASWEDGAQIVDKDADQLQRQTENAVHVHNVRLSRALELRRAHDARGEIQVLRGYMSGKTGAYADWLSKLEREMEQQANSKKGS